MKYAREVIELMSAYPGRDFRMAELVRYVNPGATTDQKHSLRRAILRVLDLLEDTGAILKQPAAESGGFAEYQWRSGSGG